MKDESKERNKALELAISQIEKQFGKGSIMTLGKEPKIDVDSYSTGALSLDMALGVGGVPRGRIVEIFGPESSGKTTLTLSIIAQAQKAGGNAVFIDAEHALQPSYAKLLGVDIDSLHVSQPDTGEEALEIADQLVRSGAVDIIVIDSVAALVPRAEIEGEMGDAHVGLQARLMSQALRKLTGSISRSNCVVIFINQIRMKIGVMFGNPETTTGGNALKFYSSVRLDIRRIASIKEGDKVIGNRTRVRVVKNKVAAPFRVAEFDILYDEGISKTGELIDLGLDTGLVQKSGTWMSYGEHRLGQGRENARRTLRENPEMLGSLEREVKMAMGLLPPDVTLGGSGTEDAEAAGADEAKPGGKASSKTDAKTDSKADDPSTNGSGRSKAGKSREKRTDQGRGELSRRFRRQASRQPPDEAGSSTERPVGERLRSRALELLARRERSCQGLRASLLRSGATASDVDPVIEELSAQGWVDDARYCRAYLLHHARLRPRSVRLLAQELRREGCADDVIARVRDELSEVLDEDALARAAAEKGARTRRGDVGRLMAYLARRGFAHSTVQRALETLGTEGPPEAGDPGDQTDCGALGDAEM